MDILEYYGFQEDPFKFTPDPSYYFQSVTHQRCYSSLEYSVKQREGFTVITGEPGTGKTMLLKVFMNNWKDKAEIALIMIPRLSPNEFLMTLLEDFGIDYSQKTNKVNIFQDFLLEKATKDKIVIIIVDEAQNLPNETIEELRLLSNLETHDHKLLHIILFGQPELNIKLNSPDLRQLAQRIMTRCTLSPLNENDTQDYIKSRIFRASSNSNLRLSRAALKTLYKHSNGIPRIINSITSRALMATYLDESKLMEKHHVKHGLKSLGLSEVSKKPIQFNFTFFMISVAILLIFVTYYDSPLLNKPTPVTLSPTSTPTPSPTPTNQLKPITKHVIADWANVRQNPALNSEILTSYPKGKTLQTINSTVDDNNRVWYKVYIDKTNYGWISANVLD
ncbi:MAG: AAA family ATPase [Candidatus Magnetoovum sp. WYHC-5]|nr:AAA family ATPase [Candidatus Magnetoovum sp. WYHC-5]